MVSSVLEYGKPRTMRTTSALAVLRQSEVAGCAALTVCRLATRVYILAIGRKENRGSQKRS